MPICRLISRENVQISPKGEFVTDEYQDDLDQRVLPAVTCLEGLITPLPPLPTEKLQPNPSTNIWAVRGS